MGQSSSSHPGGTRTIASATLLATIVFCLLSIDALNTDQTRVSDATRIAQNSSASALYLKLAALAQPTTTSDVTHALLEFIRHDDLIVGTTLLDADGRLIAQLGTGNDSLDQNPANSPTARIPIRSTEDSIFGHAVIAFGAAQHNIAHHHIAQLGAFSLIVLALTGLLYVHRYLFNTLAFFWRSRIVH
ncbi:MAG: hypothetical protein AB8B97_09740 [Granulosicoccus sp.]